MVNFWLIETASPAGNGLNMERKEVICTGFFGAGEASEYSLELL